MKKNIINLSIITIILFFMIIIFLNRLLVVNTVVSSTYIFLNRIFPTLFVMFIIQDLLINYNFNIYITKSFGFIFHKIFKLSSYGSLITILSLVGGTPSSAYMINNIYLDNKISKDEADYLLKFTYFANPLFLYNILFQIFNSDFISFKIIFAVYISNFIIILFSRKEFSNTLTFNKSSISFSKVLVNSIKKNMNIMISILGTITFFFLISNVLSLYFSNIDLLIKGVLEITIGLESLLNINLNINIKEIISVLIISFGGLSIHMQVYGAICESKLNYMSFLKGRILASIIAVILIILI